MNKITSQEYYLQMVVAWLISFAYIKQKHNTEIYLQKNNLDKFTQNKETQKICKSFKVDEKDKKIEKIKKISQVVIFLLITT